MRTFKDLQWYAQRTLLGYRTFMATVYSELDAHHSPPLPLLTQPSYRQGLPVSRTQGGESGLPSMATGFRQSLPV